MVKRRPIEAIHYSEWQKAPKALPRRVPPQTQVLAVPAKKAAPPMLRLRTGGLSGSMLSLVLAGAVLACVLVSVYAPAQSLAPAPTRSSSTFLKLQPSAPSAKKPKIISKPTGQPVLASLHDTTTCPHGNILVAVAHQDDDILFMNPSLQQAVAAGTCVRVIYVTAGDDGRSVQYWQQREQGPDAAYAAMAGVADEWQHTTVKIQGHTVGLHTLAAKPQLSLVFLHLPDGNTTGQGFPSTNYESLQKLHDADIFTIRTVTGDSSYTPGQLIGLLQYFITVDQPSDVYTQAFWSTFVVEDHSDHQAVGYYTWRATRAAHSHATFHRFIGYPSGTMPVNLSPSQIQQKQAIFGTYEHEDSLLCSNTDDCSNGFMYGRYLGREYEQTL